MYGEATSAMLASRYGGYAGTTNYPIDRVDLFEEEYGWTPASHSTGGGLDEDDLDEIADSVTYGGLLSRIGDTLRAGSERRQERRQDRREGRREDIQEGWEGLKHIFSPEATAMPGLELPQIQTSPQAPRPRTLPSDRPRKMPKHQRPPKHKQLGKHKRLGKHQRLDSRGQDSRGGQDFRAQGQHQSRQQASHDQQGRKDYQAQSQHQSRQQASHDQQGRKGYQAQSSHGRQQKLRYQG